jgi:pimeloyl-ACP methyl ester carboxylesterase
MVRRVMTTAAVVLALLLGAAGSVREPAAAQDATPDAAGGSHSQMVDIGGRSLLLECQGDGSPTVILEAGRFPSAEWSAVLAGASRFTRVCRYDRANTGDSDPAPLPRTGQDVATDLHALLTAANVPGPYVLVGETLGGLFVRLYAAAYPDDVAGMVLAEAVHEETFTAQGLLITPEDMAETIRLDFAGGDPEGIWTAETYSITLAQMRAAREASPLNQMPLVVLASGQEPHFTDSPYPPASDIVWNPLATALQASLSTLTPDARLVVLENSGRRIHEDDPRAIVAAIHDVVNAVRDPSTWQHVPATPAS